MIILEFTSLVGLAMLFYFSATTLAEFYRKTGFKDNFLMNLMNRMKLTRYKGGPNDVKQAYKNMKRFKERKTFKSKFRTEDSQIGEKISDNMETIKGYIENDYVVDQQAAWFQVFQHYKKKLEHWQNDGSLYEFITLNERLRIGLNGLANIIDENSDLKTNSEKVTEKCEVLSKKVATLVSSKKEAES